MIQSAILVSKDPPQAQLLPAELNFGRADCITVPLTFRDGVHGVCDRSRITDVDVEWYKQAFQRPGAIAASINYYRCGHSGGGRGVQRKREGREATHAVVERGRVATGAGATGKEGGRVYRSLEEQAQLGREGGREEGYRSGRNWGGREAECRCLLPRNPGVSKGRASQ